MKIESYKNATPLIQKIEKVDAMIKEGGITGKVFRLSILNQNLENTGKSMDIGKMEDFIGVGLWNLLCGYQKFLYEKLEKL